MLQDEQMHTGQLTAYLDIVIRPVPSQIKHPQRTGKKRESLDFRLSFLACSWHQPLDQ